MNTAENPNLSENRLREEREEGAIPFRLTDRVVDDVEGIARIKDMGFSVDDANEPAPENVPDSNEPVVQNGNVPDSNEQVVQNGLLSEEDDEVTVVKKRKSGRISMNNSCQLHRSQKERCLRFIQEKVVWR